MNDRPKGFYTRGDKVPPVNVLCRSCGRVFIMTITAANNLPTLNGYPRFHSAH